MPYSGCDMKQISLCDNPDKRQFLLSKGNTFLDGWMDVEEICDVLYGFGSPFPCPL